MATIHVGIIGLGANTRARHVPGLRQCRDVEITAVCNRRPESTAAAAREFSIPRTYQRWQDLIADDQIDAVVIGTWPYLHCDVTLAALAAGKHVLTEARMARNLAEARQMFTASQQAPQLVCQIVPSPFGLRCGQVVAEKISTGYLGRLREVVVLGINAAFAEADSPRHWRQVREYNGLNMLTLGILHETLLRWIADPTHVSAQAATFIDQRHGTEQGTVVPVESPDHVSVLTELPGGARAVYHLSGAVHFGPGSQIQLYGSDGTLKYHLAPDDRLWGARVGDTQLSEISIPEEKSGGWRVEEEFIGAIRGEEEVRLTSFTDGVRYMTFTEAVARSIDSGARVTLADL